MSLIAGFLGAGKTTLLSHVLRSAGGVRIGVLVNDFGDVSIDAELISEIEGGVMRLTNGCICCTIRNDVTRALFHLIESNPIDHVIIETSGLSDPRALAETFLELQKSGVIRLDGLISVVDGENFQDTLRDHGDLARAQVQAADLVVLSKTDLAGELRALAVEAEIAEIAPRARVIRAVQGQVPLEAILAIESDTTLLDKVPVHGLDEHAGHDHSVHGFISWTFREDRPLTWMKLAPLLTQLPRGVFRVKGVMSLTERKGDRILLHVVGGRVHVRTIEPWGDRPARSELVFIGTKEALDAAELEARLRACVT